MTRSADDATSTPTEPSDAHHLNPPIIPQGRVAFSTDGDRIAWTQVEQMIDGKYKILGYFDGQTDNLTWYNVEIWVGK